MLDIYPTRINFRNNLPVLSAIADVPKIVFYSNAFLAEA